MLGAFRPFYQQIDRSAWRNYSLVLSCSEEVAKRIIESKLAKREHIRVLYPGVDCSEMRPTWQYEKYFLLVSRLKWWKNVGLAIQGFMEFLRISPIASEFRLIIAGQVATSAKDYLSELKRMCKGCANITIITDPSPDEIRELYASCYAALNTTLNEDWGLVPVEANAFGKPVIAVDKGGPKESQVNGKTGYLVPPEPGAFAQAMARLARDEQLVRTMGRVARQNARQYDWSHFVDRIDLVLEKLVGSVR